MTFDTIPAPTPIIQYLAHHMRNMLPPPLLDTDDEYLRRDDAALALLMELAPQTLAEAEQAAILVGCNAYGMDCFRLAGTAGTDSRLELKCVAQAVSMFRASEAARRRLAKLQAGRATPATGAEPAAAAPQSSPSATPESEDPQALAEAEAFARQCPRRAIQIRRMGCVPKGITYTPPRPAVVRALVKGQTPALRKLDRKVA